MKIVIEFYLRKTHTSQQHCRVCAGFAMTFVASMMFVCLYGGKRDESLQKILSTKKKDFHAHPFYTSLIVFCQNLPNLFARDARIFRDVE